MDKKIIVILRKLFLLNWPYEELLHKTSTQHKKHTEVEQQQTTDKQQQNNYLRMGSSQCHWDGWLEGLWIFYVFVLSCVCCVFVRVCMCFVVTCWERADLLALVCGVCCEFVTFPLVPWVRCGTWLYRFLIFAPLFTLDIRHCPNLHTKIAQLACRLPNLQWIIAE